MAKLTLQAVDEIPDPYSRVLRMLADGKKHREIAEALGIKESTASTHIRRARERLRRLIIERHPCLKKLGRAAFRPA
jgi:RNA polymerase sigma factor (sigma-70 family)